MTNHNWNITWQKFGWNLHGGSAKQRQNAVKSVLFFVTTTTSCFGHLSSSDFEYLLKQLQLWIGVLVRTPVKNFQISAYGFYRPQNAEMENNLEGLLAQSVSEYSSSQSNLSHRYRNAHAM